MSADETRLSAALLPPSAQLSGPVLRYCRKHRYEDELVDYRAGDLPIRRDGRGGLILERANAPEIILMSVMLLDAADPTALSFNQATGVLTLHVVPKSLRYQVLYPAMTSMAVVCRLLDESTSPADS